MTLTFLDFKKYQIQYQYLCKWSYHLHKFDLLIPTFAILYGIKSLTGLNTLRNEILFDTEKFDMVSNQFQVSSSNRTKVFMPQRFFPAYAVRRKYIRTQIRKKYITYFSQIVVTRTYILHKNYILTATKTHSKYGK